jgi:hypothetical protein
VEISALDAAGAPYIQTNTWQVWPTAGNITTQCRLGNLTGITASAQEYGLVCGAPNVNTQPSIRLSNQAFQLRNLPIDVWNLGAQVLKIDPTVPSLALGNPLPASFAGGNAGLWMGRDTTDSVYKLRIGNATNFLTWNGTTLSMAGNGSGITNINGGNIQAGTITSSQVNITPAGAALNDDPNTSSSSAWADNAGLTPATILSITDGVVGSTVLRSQVGHSASMGTVKATPIDAHKTYRIHAWARAGSGATGWFSLGANLFTSSGYLTTLQPFYQQYPGTLWTEYTAVLAGLPAAAVAIAPTIQLNAIAGNAPVSTMEVQDVRIEEVLPSTLIKDGAITTVKIQAGAITADQIAANTITVANLNASGFGDNLIKNSTFEGSTQAAALAGWSPDPTSVGTFQQTCCGDRGPGTLLMVSTGASNEIAEYAAVPVQAGQTYRVSTDAYVPATSGGFYFILLESTSTAPVRYVRQSATALGPGDVAPTSSTTVCNACTLQTGWQHVERSYTVPAGVNWVSLSLWNFSCPGPCQSFYFDAVEMQPQIGAGHILANSITADRIVAHSLTAAQILGGTITGTEIAGNTITGAKIAGRTIAAGNLIANTITSNEIGVGAIVAGNIAAGTITANEIAANTITANKLNVSTLSAITANLGAVNAGSLNAVTITGSTITGTTVSAGCATMDSNGITLTAGGAACNWYKWSNGGTGMSTDGGAWMYVQGQNVQLIGTGSGSYLNVASDAHLTGTNQVILDSNNNLIHLTNNGYLQLQISSLSGTAAGSHMCLTTDNYVIRCT